MANPSKDTVKEVEFYSIGNLIKVKWKDGGVVPKDLSGSYTSKHVAQVAVDHYLRTRRTPKNAKARSGTK